MTHLPLANKTAPIATESAIDPEPLRPHASPGVCHDGGTNGAEIVTTATVRS